MVSLTPLRLILKPGRERWSLKTATDAQAAFISLSPQPTTVSDLSAVRPPPVLPPSTRIPHIETTVFSLDVTLTGYKEEQDGDLHLILADEGGQTMIGEIPDPDFVGGSSPFKDAITAARASFDARFTTTPNLQTVTVPVHIEGVGFFDRLHGQDGVAPNGIEIHPILSISFSEGA